MTVQTPNYWHRLKAADPDIYMAFSQFADAIAALARVSAATNYRGTWASSTAYKAGELAVYSGTTYIALLPSTNQTPATTSLYWAPLGSTTSGSTVDGLTVAKTAQAGVAETIITAGVSDAAGSWVLANGRSTDAKFSAKFTVTQTQAVATGGVPCVETVAVIDTENTGNECAAHRFTTTLSGGGALTVQRMWELVNGTSKVVYVQPVRSDQTATVAIVNNSSRVENPTFDASGGEFSAGARFVLSDCRSSTSLERAIGVATNGVYISAQASDDIRFWWDQSGANFVFKGDGDFFCQGEIVPGGNASGTTKSSTLFASSGSPYGAYSAGPGSIHMENVTNTAGAFNWKATGTGNTGWVRWSAGSGSPETVVTGRIGDLYCDLAGGAGTVLYVKESGSSNTGWVAK